MQSHQVPVSQWALRSKRATFTSFDPGDEGCPVEFQDWENEFTIVLSPTPGQAPGGALIWEGQNFSFSDVQNNPGSWSTCFDAIENFTVKVIVGGNIETFFVVGTAFKRGDLPPVFGAARARYQLPDQYMYSKSGNYRIFGG